MSLDFTLPSKTQAYDAGMLASIRAHVVALACMLDPGEASVGAVSNTPAGARRFNSATGVFQRFDGAAWVEQGTAYLKASLTQLVTRPVTGGVNGSTRLVRAGYLDGSGGYDHSVQATWDSTYWLLRGFDGADAYHAPVRVGYADSAGAANSVAWINVSGRPTDLGSFANGPGFITAASLLWVNISGRPTDLGSFSNGPNYATTAALGAYAALASGPTFSGVVKGNGGGIGLGKITVTNVTGSPSGMSAGDLVLVY